jgi:hypothetical protein
VSALPAVRTNLGARARPGAARRALLAALTLGACGAAAPARGPAPAPVPAPAPAPADAPTAAECAELIRHAVTLRTAELGAALPAERLPAEADRDALAAELSATFLPACRRGTRRGYGCAMAARSLAELGACGDPTALGYRTPSSSTSNSSVAPGGITPPAPRSP